MVVGSACATIPVCIAAMEICAGSLVNERHAVALAEQQAPPRKASPQHVHGREREVLH
jgi:hypothetical protein